MASFTDQPVNFTPYISEQPVDALVQVGITKQQQYAEGLQKVQTYMDTLGGLDLSKQEIKDYVQQKMASLHQTLNNVSGDFSSSRLVNQIGGAASKIANDPIVQNGILATSAIKTGYANMEASRKEGKSNPNNEIFFTDKVSEWQNDGQVKTKFEGEYTPYFDIVGEVRKVYKDMTQGQDLPPGFGSRNIKKDANGNVIFDLNYTGNMVNMEGISVDRVQHAVDLVMQNGNARQQLNIDGYATYRGVEPPQMFEAIKGSTQKQLKVWNDAIVAAQSKLGGSTAGDKAQLASDITKMNSLSEQLVAQSDSYIQALGSNPEGVKASLVEQELRTDLVGAFAYQKMVESPLWNANKELEKMQLDKDKFTFEQFNEQRKFELETFKAQSAAETARIKAEKEKADLEGKNYVAPLPVPNTAGQAGSASMYKLKDDARLKAEDVSFQALSEYARVTNQPMPFKLDPATNRWIPNPEGFGGGPEGTKRAYEARIQLVQDMKSRRSKGTLTPEASIAMQKEESAWDEYNLIDNKILDIEKSVKPLLDAVQKEVGLREDGSKYPADWFDIITVRQSLPGSEIADQRLKNKYGEGWKRSMTYGTPKSPVKLGKENEEFYRLEKKVMNSKTGVIEAQQQIEDKFRGSQFAYENKATVFDRNTDKLKEDVKTAFTAALTPQALATEGKPSDANEMKEWMSDKTDKQKDDQYMAWQEYNGGKPTWWIGIQRGDEFKKVQVKQDTFLQNRKLQQAIPNVEFQNMFATRLALREGQDTYIDDKDVTKNSGQVSAYPIYMNSGTIKYTEGDQAIETQPTVQFHLEQPATAQGQYRIKLYITDSKSGKVLVQGAPYPPADMTVPGQTPALTQEQVMDQVKFKLSNPAFIQGYLDKYYNKK